MKFAKSIYQIKNPPKDTTKIKEMSEFIVQWCDNHDVSIDIYIAENSDIMCAVDVQGRTTAYCIGVTKEVKEMLKMRFGTIVTYLDAH